MRHTETDSTLAERLTRARRLAGLSARALSELARDAGVGTGSDAHVGMIERGTVKYPRPETLARLAAVLGVSLDWLITGNGDEPTAEQVRAAVDAARGNSTAA
jgi:transcriptional regulator with XRE-family HTH domain